MVFGLMLSNDMYLLMVFLQFAAVCLVVIPWAFALAIFCNFAIVFYLCGDVSNVCRWVWDVCG